MKENVTDEKIASHTKDHVLRGVSHKPFTGQRLFITFVWDLKCQRAEHLSLISRQKLLASAQPAG